VQRGLQINPQDLGLSHLLHHFNYFETVKGLPASTTNKRLYKMDLAEVKKN
tara:strand:+ start:384 stop:536 length:153 start_codon:yes stop_codon:yes gene_type:complete